MAYALRAAGATMQPNYHHLFHFWRAARAGSLVRAAEELNVTHATLSVQVKALEESLGTQLFTRRGRRLVLTPAGEQVADSCDDLFRLGAEIAEIGRSNGPFIHRVAFRVGVVAALPKSVAYAFLRPVLSPDNRDGDDAVEHRPVLVRQASLDRLLEDLVAGRLHLLLTDVPPPEARSHRVFVHELGQSGILLYGTPRLVNARRGRFPRSLQGAPMLLPLAPSFLRRQIDRWLVERAVRVRVEAELEDASMMRMLGLHGHGLFPVREALRAEVEEAGAVTCLSPLEGVRERYYAVSAERRLRHPAMSVIIENARAGLARAVRESRAKGRPRTNG